MLGIKRTRGAILATTTMLLGAALSGCVGGMGSDGILAGLNDDPMVSITVSSAGGFPDLEQYSLVGQAAQSCGVVIKTQITGAWHSRISGAAIYAPSGALAGSGQLAYPGATPETAAAGALVGVVQGIGSGIAYGSIVHGQSTTSQITECINNALQTWEDGDRIPPAILASHPNVRELAVGLRAHASFVETRNRTGQPAWGGARAGDVIDDPRRR